MKIRNGFVSNSSSSSFIIFGKEIEESQANIAMLEGKNVYAEGKYLSDGIDFFKLTPEIFESMLLVDFNFTYWIVDKIVNYDDYDKNKNKVNISSLNLDEDGNFCVHSLLVDYHSSKSKIDIKDMYPDYND